MGVNAVTNEIEIDEDFMEISNALVGKGVENKVQKIQFHKGVWLNMRPG